MEAGMIDKIEGAEKPKLTATTLVICDAGGRVLAVSSGAASGGMFGAGAVQKHFAEVFGPDSAITSWLTEHLSEARKRGDYYAESGLESEGLKLFACIETLMNEGEIFGYALHFLPDGAPGGRRAICEGDAVVTRQQWHDVKNHLGGLKLYATYLKRKLPEGEDQQIAEKILNGVDTLIDNLAKIRRGETQ
jgi:hypothetical protein